MGVLVGYISPGGEGPITPGYSLALLLNRCAFYLANMFPVSRGGVTAILEMIGHR